MGIYIKGLTKENWDNLTIEEIEENFEVIEVKTPHGRLIDAEKIVRFKTRLENRTAICTVDAPTVIEAEVK